MSTAFLIEVKKRITMMMMTGMTIAMVRIMMKIKMGQHWQH